MFLRWMLIIAGILFAIDFALYELGVRTPFVVQSFGWLLIAVLALAFIVGVLAPSTRRR